jgi:hypothetical protein
MAVYLIYSSRALKSNEITYVLFYNHILEKPDEGFYAQALKCSINEDETMSARSTFICKGEKYQDERFVFSVNATENFQYQKYERGHKNLWSNPIITLVIAELPDGIQESGEPVEGAPIITTIFSEPMPPLSVLCNIKSVGNREYLSTYASDSSNIFTNAITETEFDVEVDTMRTRCVWRYKSGYMVFYQPREITVSLVSMLGKSVSLGMFQNRLKFAGEMIYKKSTTLSYDLRVDKCFSIGNLPYNVYPKTIALKHHLSVYYNKINDFYLACQQQKQHA